jgi:DNA gyrase subunit A
MSTIFPNAHLLTVTENGYGKRSRVSTYPLQARGGKGVVGHKITEKTGTVIAAKLVPAGQHIIIISAKGIVIRVPVDEEVSLLGRATQGVHVNRLDEDDRVVSIAYLGVEEDGENDKAAAK